MFQEMVKFKIFKIFKMLMRVNKILVENACINLVCFDFRISPACELSKEMENETTQRTYVNVAVKTFYEVAGNLKHEGVE